MGQQNHKCLTVELNRIDLPSFYGRLKITPLFKQLSQLIRRSVVFHFVFYLHREKGIFFQKWENVRVQSKLFFHMCVCVVDVCLCIYNFWFLNLTIFPFLYWTMCFCVSLCVSKKDKNSVRIGYMYSLFFCLVRYFTNVF